MEDCNSLPDDAADVLRLLCSGIRNLLGEKLLGLYLHGSLVTGDFESATSDIDVLAVVNSPITEELFDALYRLHRDLDALSSPLARRLEIAYIDRLALRRYRPGLHHPTLE